MVVYGSDVIINLLLLSLLLLISCRCCGGGDRCSSCFNPLRHLSITRFRFFCRTNDIISFSIATVVCYIKRLRCCYNMNRRFFVFDGLISVSRLIKERFCCGRTRKKTFSLQKFRQIGIFIWSIRRFCRRQWH